MNRTNPENADALPPKQARAVPIVAASPSLAAAARAANVSRTTLRRWMEDHRFRTKLERLNQEAADLAFSQLQALAPKCLSALSDLLDSPDPRVRISAARTAIQFLFRLDADRNIKNRLDILDNTFALIQEQR